MVLELCVDSQSLGSAAELASAPRGSGGRRLSSEVVVASLEILSGRSKKEYAKEAEAVAAGEPVAAQGSATQAANGAAADAIEAVVAM
jgi:hypothetical protein